MNPYGQEAGSSAAFEVREHRAHVDESRTSHTDLPPELRGGGGPDYDPKEGRSDGDSPNFPHQRGGGGGGDDQKERKTNTEESNISLFFFCTSRGEVISSRKFEQYRGRGSDRWLVKRLRRHYEAINQQQSSIFWNLISMKTIGFATFIRFQYTDETDQHLGYIASAVEPAVSGEGDGTSHFQYLMRHPLAYKLMLSKLDNLVAGTKDDQQNRSFYVVQIKEGLNTTKIYILFTLIILASTGGGVVYAVVKADTSTGLTISSYVLTCLSLILAVVGAGQWLGLTKPDSFSFAYDVEANQVISAPYANQIFGHE